MPLHHAHDFKPDDLEVQQMYKLMIGSVVPRPIAWVSSQSSEGILNIAPFSFFTVASRNPPTLLFSVGPGVQERTGTTKDTLSNIREVNEFVVNIVSNKLANHMHRTSLHYPAEVDEFKKSGLTPAPSNTINVPSILEAPIAFECKRSNIIQVGTDHLILGEVQHVKIDKDAYAGDFKTAIEHWEPLARMAGDYSTLTPSFSLPRP